MKDTVLILGSLLVLIMAVELILDVKLIKARNEQIRAQAGLIAAQEKYIAAVNKNIEAQTKLAEARGGYIFELEAVLKKYRELHSGEKIQ